MTDTAYTIHDLARLDHPALIQLWQSSPAPEHSEVNGEYLARPLDMKGGRFRRLFTLGFCNWTGLWLGKAFAPSATNRGRGYNYHYHPKKGIIRQLPMNTSVKKSNFDDKDSFIVDYSETMKSSKDRRGRDEIRKISDDLYLGIGYFLDRHGNANLDKTRTYPFSLEGPAKPFRGEQFE